MDTRKVKVTVTRYYFKQASIEIDVPIDIKGQDLIDLLTTSEDLDDKVNEKIDESSLLCDDDIWEFQDVANNFGGHL